MMLKVLPVLCLFFMTITQLSWAEILQNFRCLSDGKIYQAEDSANCTSADQFASDVLGFSSFDEVKQALSTKNVDALATASKGMVHVFWNYLLESEKNQQAHQLESRRQWTEEIQSKACENPESSVCKTITAGLLNHYLLSPEAEYFTRLPDVKSIAVDSMDILHEQLLSMSSESPVARVRRQVVENIINPGNIKPSPHFNCHLGSFIDSQTQEAQSFLKSDHSNEILNFVWFGPNFPAQYARNLWAWADAYPNLTVVLWYSSVDLDDQDHQAYLDLPGKRANLQARNIKAARLDLIDVNGINVEELLDKVLESDMPPGIRYPSGSNIALVALIARGGQAVPDSGSENQKGTMIYFDHDITFSKTCGFQPLKDREGQTYIHLYNSETAKEEYHMLYPSADILAAKQANHPDIMKLLGSLTEIYQEVMNIGRSEFGELPVAFDAELNDISPAHRFPLLWNLPLYDSDRTWKDDPKSLLLNKWKDEL